MPLTCERLPLWPVPFVVPPVPSPRVLIFLLPAASLPKAEGEFRFRGEASRWGHHTARLTSGFWAHSIHEGLLRALGPSLSFWDYPKILSEAWCQGLGGGGREEEAGLERGEISRPTPLQDRQRQCPLAQAGLPCPRALPPPSLGALRAAPQRPRPPLGRSTPATQGSWLPWGGGEDLRGL